MGPEDGGGEDDCGEIESVRGPEQTRHRPQHPLRHLILI